MMYSPLVVYVTSEGLSGKQIASGVDGISVIELGDVVVVFDASFLNCVLRDRVTIHGLPPCMARNCSLCIDLLTLKPDQV